MHSAFIHGNMHTYADNSVVQKTFLLLCLCISILISPYLKLDQTYLFTCLFCITINYNCVIIHPNTIENTEKRG